MTEYPGRPVVVRSPALIEVELPITLGQVIKLAGMAATGGHAKASVAAGLVLVNGRVETRRGRKLTPGDVVEMEGGAAVVVAIAPSPRVAATDSPISGPDGPEGPPIPNRPR